MNALIKKLLEIEFVCVNIDEDAKALYLVDIHGGNANIRNFIFRNDDTDLTRREYHFRSFKTMETYEAYLKEPTLENHHLCFHYILVDRFIDWLIYPHLIPSKSIACLDTIEDALQCAPNSVELIQELSNYVRSKRK